MLVFLDGLLGIMFHLFDFLSNITAVCLIVFFFMFLPKWWLWLWVKQQGAQKPTYARKHVWMNTFYCKFLGIDGRKATDKQLKQKKQKKQPKKTND